MVIVSGQDRSALRTHKGTLFLKGEPGRRGQKGAAAGGWEGSR